MSDESHAVYYFPPLSVTGSSSHLVTGIYSLDYPNTEDVAIRYNNVYYTGTRILFLQHTTDKTPTKYMVYETVDATSTKKYYLAISLLSNADAPANCVNDLLTLATSDTAASVKLDYASIMTTATPPTTSYKKDNDILTVLDIKLPIASPNLTTSITSEPSSIPFDASSISIQLELGEPKMEMSCSHKGDDMSSQTVSKQQMTDKDIMQMIATYLIVFVGLVSGYAFSFSYLYKFMVIDVFKKYSKDPLSSAITYPNAFWIITLVVYSIITMLYGIRFNNGTFIAISIFFVMVIGVSQYLVKSNSEFINMSIGTLDWSEKFFKNRFALGGGVLAFISLVLFGIMGMVAAFGLGHKDKYEEVFTGLSTTMLLGSVIGYVFIVIGSKLIRTP